VTATDGESLGLGVAVGDGESVGVGEGLGVGESVGVAGSAGLVEIGAVGAGSRDPGAAVGCGALTGAGLWLVAIAGDFWAPPGAAPRFGFTALRAWRTGCAFFFTDLLGVRRSAAGFRWLKCGPTARAIDETSWPAYEPA
jgi:hypothetical protein